MNPASLTPCGWNCGGAALSYAVLAQLRKEHYGYTLRKALADERAGDRGEHAVSACCWRRLETQGLLTSEWREEEKRNKRFYKLSAEGKTRVEAAAGGVERNQRFGTQDFEGRKVKVTTMNANTNDLLERYLQAVGQFLPAAAREDTMAELRVNLLEQMDARAEELGHALTEAEMAEILRSHGRPEVVAARYLPQRSLIGPALFPVYLFALRKALPLVVLIYAIARGVRLIAAPMGRVEASQIGPQIVEAVLNLVPTLLMFWATVTIVFAVIEFVQGHCEEGSKWWPRSTWDPAKLPAVKVEDGMAKRRSLTSRVADLVVHCLWMAYCLAVPLHPFLLLGPGIDYLSSRHVRFAPVWHTWFLFLVALLLVQLLMKLIAIASQDSSLLKPLHLLTSLLSIAASGLVAFTGEYFVPTSAAADLHMLATVNHGMALAVRIALFCAILGLITDGWKTIRRHIPRSVSRSSGVRRGGRELSHPSGRICGARDARMDGAPGRLRPVRADDYSVRLRRGRSGAAIAVSGVPRRRLFLRVRLWGRGRWQSGRLRLWRTQVGRGRG